MDESSGNITFSCPTGFTKEEIVSCPQLCVQDLDEDSELWLVRIPSDIDPRVLEKTNIFLDGSTNLLTSNSQTYECFAQKGEIPNLCLVLPDKENNILTGSGKVFQGSVFISECLDNVIKLENCEENIENEIDISVEKKKSKNKKHKNEQPLLASDEIDFQMPMCDEIPEVKQTRKEKKKNKHKKEDEVNEIDFQMPMCDEIPEIKQTRKEKKKNKHKKEDEVDMSLKNNLAEMQIENSRSSKRDKKKKKHKLMEMEIKTEEDFPHCYSQKDEQSS